MTTRLGRVLLTTPLSVEYQAGPAAQGGIGSNPYAKGYLLRGRENGSTAAAAMDALAKEGLRFGDVYCSSDDALFAAGYYRFQSPPRFEMPGGAPKRRPWAADIQAISAPVVTRQAEDDAVAGTIGDDVEADEERRVSYVPTTDLTDVLRPRSVVDAEPLDLPHGTYRFVARVKATVTATAAFVGILDDADGDALVTGSEVEVGAGNEDQWVEVDLGAFTVPAAHHGANWYRVQIRDPTNTNPVLVDRIRLVPA